jgi:hypothetical protein
LSVKRYRKGRKMLGRIRQELISWLPIIATIIVVLLTIVLVIFLFTNPGGNTPVWLQAAVTVTIVVLLGILAISVLAPAPAAGVADPVPIRIGVILLGVIVVACVAGLIQIVNSPPQVVEPTPPLEASQGGSPSQGDGTAGGGEASPAPATSSVANTANLGLSGQIVGIFGTIAAAAVGGIAGLLTPRGG